MIGLVTMGATANAFTVTTMAALGPSQVPVVWLTYQMVVPTVAVDGVGAVGEPVPPEALVYHNRPDPAAVI